jgi:hypothetical protein
MYWECTECGGYTRKDHAPTRCRECGTAGVFFVPVEAKEPFTADPEAESLRSVWVRSGLGQAHAVLPP